jgi:ABC-2 type transport system ATP-binding protein
MTIDLREGPRGGPTNARVADSPDGQPAIHVAGLTKRLGTHQALAGIDFDVPVGQVVTLLGHNGAGKSTLTRILATTVLPDGGSAQVCGFDVVTHPMEVRYRLGVTLSDERSWYWRLTGRHNLEFFAALYGFYDTGARERASELLETVGLADAADRRFDGYSAGMKARLSLARALLPDPPVLLLDEPTRSMDPIAAAEFRDLVEDLVRRRGKTILLTTHNLHEAAALADHVVVLRSGQVQARVSGQQSAERLEAMLLEAMRA